MNCNRCNRDNLTTSNFYIENRRECGHTLYCKNCHKELSKQRYKTGERNLYLKEYRREWRKENPYIYKKHRLDYENRKRNNGGNFTIKDWKQLLKKHRGKCVNCGNNKNITIDHIVPVVLGGTNNIENLQPLCLSCNSSKSTKIIKYELRGQLGLVFTV